MSCRSGARAIAAAFLVMVLGGCATGSNPDASAAHAPNAADPDASRPPDVLVDLVTDRLGTAAPGALVATRDARLGVAEVVVEEPYRAASGRDCRRLLDTSGRPLGRVVCATGQGRWQLGRPLVAGDATRAVIDSPLAPASRARQ